MRIGGRRAERFDDRPHDRQARQLPVLRARRIVRIGVDDVIALLDDVAAQLGDEIRPRGLLDQPDVEGRGRAIGHDRSRAGPDERAGQAADVQRRHLHRVLQLRKGLFRRGNAERREHGRRVVRHRVEHRALVRGRRRHRVVVALDSDPALVILHRREQRGQAHRRVRHPVTVVAAVHAALRTEHGEVHRRDAAGAIDNRGAAARVPRPVEDDHQIGAQLVLVARDRRDEAGGAGLFLAVEDDADVRRGGQPLRFQRVDGGHEGDDRRLVVGRGPGVDPRVGAVAAHHRRERIRLVPLRPIDRLAVVVAVEEHRSRGSRHVERAVDERVACRLEHLRRKSVSREHGLEVIRITADVRLVRRDVRYRQRFQQLVDDLALVRPDPGRHAGFEIDRLGQQRHDEEPGNHLYSS